MIDYWTNVYRTTASPLTQPASNVACKNWDTDREMIAVDSLGPISRALVKDTPREVRVHSLMSTYKGKKGSGRFAHLFNWKDPTTDRAFADWVIEQYEQRQGIDPSKVVVRQLTTGRVTKAAQRQLRRFNRR